MDNDESESEQGCSIMESILVLDTRYISTIVSHRSRNT